MDNRPLFSTNQERDELENLADLYSIIVTTEHLEKAYVRDSISAKEYTDACFKLIAQYKTVQKLLNVDIHKFVRDYRIDCKAALNRLVIVGVPATVEHGHVEAQQDTSATQGVAETVQHFITVMDSLKLNMLAVDQVQPLLVDLLESLNRLALHIIRLGDLEGKSKLKNWLIVLNSMKASDELTEEQSRQLLFDLESSYRAFYEALKTEKKYSNF